jgi:hypothetical protein
MRLRGMEQGVGGVYKSSNTNMEFLATVEFYLPRIQLSPQRAIIIFEIPLNLLRNSILFECPIPELVLYVISSWISATAHMGAINGWRHLPPAAQQLRPHNARPRPKARLTRRYPAPLDSTPPNILSAP